MHAVVEEKADENLAEKTKNNCKHYFIQYDDKIERTGISLRDYLNNKQQTKHAAQVAALYTFFEQDSDTLKTLVNKDTYDAQLSELCYPIGDTHMEDYLQIRLNRSKNLGVIYAKKSDNITLVYSPAMRQKAITLWLSDGNAKDNNFFIPFHTNLDYFIDFLQVIVQDKSLPVYQAFLEFLRMQDPVKTDAEYIHFETLFYPMMIKVNEQQDTFLSWLNSQQRTYRALLEEGLSIFEDVLIIKRPAAHAFYANHFFRDDKLIKDEIHLYVRQSLLLDNIKYDKTVVNESAWFEWYNNFMLISGAAWGTSEYLEKLKTLRPSSIDSIPDVTVYALLFKHWQILQQKMPALNDTPYGVNQSIADYFMDKIKTLASNPKKEIQHYTGLLQITLVLLSVCENKYIEQMHFKCALNEAFHMYKANDVHGKMFHNYLPYLEKCFIDPKKISTRQDIQNQLKLQFKNESSDKEDLIFFLSWLRRLLDNPWITNIRRPDFEDFLLPPICKLGVKLYPEM